MSREEYRRASGPSPETAEAAAREPDWLPLEHATELENTMIRKPQFSEKFDTVRDMIADATPEHLPYWDGYKHGYEDGQRDASHPIPVEERLPERKENVPTVSVNVLAWSDGEWWGGFYSYRNDCWFDEAADCELPNVTHWCPLPPPVPPDVQNHPTP